MLRRYQAPPFSLVTIVTPLQSVVMKLTSVQADVHMQSEFSASLSEGLDSECFQLVHDQKLI